MCGDFLKKKKMMEEFRLVLFWGGQQQTIYGSKINIQILRH